MPALRFVALWALAFGCAKAQEPEISKAPATTSSTPTTASTPSSALAPASPSAAEAPTPRTSAAVAAPAPVAQPPLLDAGGKPLPQTDERPRADDPAFLARLGLLVEAIERDDPERARAAFFPVVAYQQVKAIEKPERDHEARLMKAFARDIHEYHRALGEASEGVRLLDLELPESKVRFMKPGTEGNRLGYYRVVRPTLRLRTRDGKEARFEITSLISWRGGWYVVHLHGFS